MTISNRAQFGNARQIFGCGGIDLAQTQHSSRHDLSAMQSAIRDTHSPERLSRWRHIHIPSNPNPNPNPNQNLALGVGKPVRIARSVDARITAVPDLTSSSARPAAAEQGPIVLGSRIRISIRAPGSFDSVTDTWPAFSRLVQERELSSRRVAVRTWHGFRQFKTNTGSCRVKCSIATR